MNRIILITFYFLYLCFGSFSFAQVTIGSGEKANRGALLDLKENTPSTAGAANSTKGLLLPRLKLSNLNSLSDIDGVDVSKHLGHTGLTVYNLNTDKCNGLYPGIHIWNGTTWNKVGKNVNFSTGKLTDNRPNDISHTYNTGHFALLDPLTSDVIAEAEWMLENLKAKTYDSGIAVGDRQNLVFHNDATQPGATEAYFTYPNKDASKFGTEGYYYSGIAALNNQVVDGLHDGVRPVPSRNQQGICPDGWRIPTYEDWMLLVSMLEQSECEHAFPKPENDKWWGGMILPNSANLDFRSRLAKDGGFAAYNSGSYTNNGNFNAVVDKFPTFITTYPVPVTLTSGGTKYPMYGLFSFTESQTHSQFHTSPTQNMPVRCVRGNLPPQVPYNTTKYNYLPNN